MNLNPNQKHVESARAVSQSVATLTTSCSHVSPPSTLLLQDAVEGTDGRHHVDADAHAHHLHAPRIFRHPHLGHIPPCSTLVRPLCPPHSLTHQTQRNPISNKARPRSDSRIRYDPASAHEIDAQAAAISAAR
jgi:hypothetical protein